MEVPCAPVPRVGFQRFWSRPSEAPAVTRSLDLSVSVRTRQYAVAGFVTLWAVALSFQVAAALGAPWPFPVALGAGAALWGVLTVLLARLGEAGEGSAWGPIPRWQYGRFAESGGITRKEQERVLDSAREAERERESE